MKDNPHNGTIVGRFSGVLRIYCNFIVLSLLCLGVRIINHFSLLRPTRLSSYVGNLKPTPSRLPLTLPFKHLSGDVEARKATTTWTVGSAIDDQQVGNTWSGENNLVSLSLGGNLNVFDPRTPERSARVFSVSVGFLGLCCLINYILPRRHPKPLLMPL